MKRKVMVEKNTLFGQLLLLPLSLKSLDAFLAGDSIMTLSQ